MRSRLTILNKSENLPAIFEAGHATAVMISNDREADIDDSKNKGNNCNGMFFERNTAAPVLAFPVFSTVSRENIVDEDEREEEKDMKSVDNGAVMNISCEAPRAGSNEENMPRTAATKTPRKLSCNGNCFVCFAGFDPKDRRMAGMPNRPVRRGPSVNSEEWKEFSERYPNIPDKENRRIEWGRSSMMFARATPATIHGMAWLISP